jgi:N-acetylmuramoyl-L-alanine amidase
MISIMAKVFLSAGHGGSDPGAVSNGLKEADVNLNTLLACQAELVKHGVTVVCSRVTNANDPVQEEVKEANASKADIAVSFHANAGGGDGFEAYYYKGCTKGFKLAELCEKHVKALGQNSRGLKSGNHLYFVKRTKMPAVLVESFFVDNATDKTIGDTVAEQKAFGVAYAKAIMEYLGVSYEQRLLTSANDITWELNNSYFPISDTAGFVKALDKAKNDSSPLYWGYYKLVNKVK